MRRPSRVGDKRSLGQGQTVGWWPKPSLTTAVTHFVRMRLGRIFFLACLFIATVAFADSRMFAQQPAATKPTVPSKPELSPQQLFEALGVGNEYFGRFADGKPVSETETDVLLRMLYRLRLFPRGDIERWASSVEELSQAIRDPATHRGTIYRLRGELIEVEPCLPNADAAQRYELPKYYRCRVKLRSPAPMVADIDVERVPAAWQNGAVPGTHVGAMAVFAKTVSNKADSVSLAFVASRLAWYPDTPLGELGMDVGLLDTVKDQKAVLADEGEAFYQMLAAVGRAGKGQLLREAERALAETPEPWRWKNQQGEELYSVVPLFNDAAGQRGRLVALTGTVRRIEEVPVEDRGIRERFGILHYYQVSLFTDDSSGNPLTFCIRSLPVGMPYGEATSYAEKVRIAGFFFKTWSYRVPKLADPTLSPGDPKTQRLLSPLLIGDTLTWYPAPKPEESTAVNVAIVIVFFGVMLVIWIAAWRTRRHERQMLEDAVEPAPALDSDIELIPPGEAPAGGVPDFDRIAAMDQGPDNPRGQ